MARCLSLTGTVWSAMWSIRRCSTSAVLAMVVALAGCSSAAKPAASHTPRTTATSTAARSSTTTTAAFSEPSAGLSVAFLPAGFMAFHTPSSGHVTGPIGTNDSQEFRNLKTGQDFIVSVGRGIPAAFVIGPATGFVAAAHRVHGCRTYVRNDPAATGEREFQWVVGPTTMGFVGGFKMSDAELLRIADSTTIRN